MKKKINDSYAQALRLLSCSPENIQKFAESSEGANLKESFIKTIAWCQGLLDVYDDNNARLHLVGAWNQVMTVLALVPLNFYRQSYVAMRIMIDEILAWSYFESHPIEFRTSLRNPNYWLSKDRVHEFHKNHSWQGEIKIEEIGIWSEISNLYGNFSTYIHGHLHYKMSLIESFKEFNKYDAQMVKEIIEAARKTDESIAKFLASLYQEAFTQFSPELQKLILKDWDKVIINGLKLGP